MLGRKTAPTASAPAILSLRNLPPVVVTALATAEAALSRRADLERLAAEAAAAEPVAREAAARARAVVDAIEADLAICDDDAAELAALKSRLAAGRSAAEVAAEAVMQTQRRQRGAANRLADADAAVEVAAAPLAEALVPFREELRASLRHDLHAAAVQLAAVARAGYAALAALGDLGGGLAAKLKVINVPDIAQQDGRPVPSLISGNSAWLAEDMGAVAGDNLADWSVDPALLALHELLKPLGDAERQIAAHRRRIADAAERARLAAPPPSRWRAPPDPTLGMTDEQYRAHRAAAVNASRAYPAPGPNPTYSAGARRPA